CRIQQHDILLHGRGVFGGAGRRIRGQWGSLLSLPQRRMRGERHGHRVEQRRLLRLPALEAPAKSVGRSRYFRMVEVMLTEAQNGSSVEAQSGDDLLVELEENPTSGFRWEIDRLDE